MLGLVLFGCCAGGLAGVFGFYLSRLRGCRGCGVDGWMMERLKDEIMDLCGDAWVFEEDVVCVEVAGWMGWGGIGDRCLLVSLRW